METLKTKTIVIGATGRLGIMVEKTWDMTPPAGLDIVYQSRRVLGPHQTSDKWIKWDPSEGPSGLQAYVDQTGPIHAMIVLAGAVPGRSETLLDNTTIVENCLAAAQAVGIGHVLISSSSAVYGAQAGQDFSETSDVSPQNDYGRSKRAAEIFAADVEGVHTTCLRIGNVAGADMLLGNAQSRAEGAFLQLDIYPDGTGPIRSYVGPMTFANILANLVTKRGSLPRILNIAAPKPVEMEKLLQAVNCPYIKRDVAESPAERIVLDCSQLLNFYDFNNREMDANDMVGQWKQIMKYVEQ